MQCPCSTQLPPDLKPAVLAYTANVQQLLAVGLTCTHEEPIETKWGAESSNLQLASSLRLRQADRRYKPVAGNQSFRPRLQVQNKRTLFSDTNPSFWCAVPVLSVQRSPGKLPERRVGMKCSPVRRHPLTVALKDDSRWVRHIESRLMLQSVTIAAAGARPHRHTAAKSS